MISLLIDTCTANLIIGVFKDNKLIDKVIQTNDSNLSTNFTSIIDDIFKNLNLKVSDVDNIYVAIGPGSFTGIRIGLTFAKVLAWSLNKKLIPISSLEILATGSNSEIIVPILNARRGYVYAGIYDKDLNNIMEDKYMLLSDLQELVSKYNVKDYISCDNFDFTIEPIYNLEKVLLKHSLDSGVNPHNLVPKYLKKTEAEEKLNV